MNKSDTNKIYAGHSKKKGWFDYLLNDLGSDFDVCCQAPYNSKWKKYSKTMNDDKFLHVVDSRTPLDIEIILDLEDPERLDTVTTSLDNLGHNYKVYFSGSKGYHIHLIFTGLRGYNKTKRESIREFFIGIFDCDPQLKFDRHMITGEFCNSPKTGKPKTLVKEKGDWTKNKLLDILDNIQALNEKKRIDTTTRKHAEGVLDLFENNKETIAERFYEQQPYFFDDETGLFWFWEKENKSYKQISDIALMSQLKGIANEQHKQITESKFWTETIRSMKLIGIDHQPEEFKKEWVQFYDTIYDYKTKDIITATPKYFNTNPIPWKLGEDNTTPVMDKIFAEWVTEKHVISLKETIALAILQNYPLHRIIYLFGSGCNGKGVFLRFLTNVLGADNISSTSMERLLKNDFESSKLYKKLGCLIGETNFSNMAETSLLKTLSGQDMTTAAFKGKNAFDFVNYATLFVASNSLPITSDNTPGWYRRPYILDFPNQFEEGIDPLEQIPDIEYSNLCKQLLDILPELISRGLFTHDGDFNKRMSRYEQRSNSVIYYISQHYQYNINSEVGFGDFFDGYEKYCQETKNRKIDKRNVGKILRENGYELEKKYILIDNNNQKKMLVILSLEPIEPKEPEFDFIPYIRSDPEMGSKGSMGSIGTPIIHSICRFCGATPCIGYEKTGKPICEGCAKSKKIDEESV